MYKIFTRISCKQQRCIYKCLLIMKLTTFIILIAILRVSASSYAQDVTFAKKGASVQQVLKEVHKQTGYNVLWSATKIKSTHSLDVDFKKASLTDVLDKIFDGTAFTYEIEDKNVIITERTAPLLTVFADKLRSALNIPSDITGQVVDSLGKPLAGASISLKGTNSSTNTDNNGNFTLNGIPQGSYLLSVTYIGYAKLQRPVILVGKDLNLKFILHQASSALDQVQIIAYGETTQRYSIGSVATVSAKTIEQQPVSNILLALEGQVPGLLITPSSGAPGSAVEVQIRGQGSLISNINNGTKPYDQPLFILDGVPLAAQNVDINLFNSLGTTAGGYATFGGRSPFNNINPADIESISVLKDADATSIYGTQGANGVIIITTKKGKPGKTRLDVSANSGVNVVARTVQMLNTQQYLSIRREALANDGYTPSSNPYDNGFAPDLTVFDQNKSTDYFNYLLGNTSHNSDVHASISGGSNNTSFIISGGYTHETYNFPGDYANDRATLHTSIEHTALNNRLTIDLSSDLGYANNNSSAVNELTSILTPPNYPDLIGPDGNLVWEYKGIDISQYQTDGFLKQTNDLQSFNMNYSLRLDYKILTGLDISSNLGYSRLSTVENTQLPIAAQNPAYNPLGTAQFGNSLFQTINIEPQLNYKHDFGKGQLSALLGGTYKKDHSNSTQLDGKGYDNDSLLGSINSAQTITATDADNLYKYAALFARIGYIYDKKYIISLTGRRDGSSNFGPGRQFGDFGSAGLGWIFSEEKAFQSLLPIVSYGKLSATYGTSGSDGVAPYQYQAFWQPGSYVPLFQGTRPYSPANLYNPDYSWDLKKTFNAALDLGFWHDRLLLNATLYQSRISDQLTSGILPSQTGFTSVVENFNATVQNRGWEFTLTSTNVTTKNFKWTTNFNISGNSNKLIAFPGLASSPYAFYYTIGEPTSEINGFKYKDVNPATGIFEFYKANGTVTSTPNYALESRGGDLQPIANLTPKFFGGFGNTLTYKAFSFYFMFQFSRQTGINYLGSIYANPFDQPGSFANQPIEVLNHWSKPGDISDIEKLTTGYSPSSNYFIASSGAYSDASYIRLKTLAFSYTLPGSFLNKLNIKSCKFYINAQNLLTFTSFKVGDPESPGGLFSFPLQRTIVCGLSFNF